MNPHSYELYVNGRLVHRNRSGKIAFQNFASYNVGDWFNYPKGERVEQVQLIRDDGMIQDKGQKPARMLPANPLRDDVIVGVSKQEGK